MDSAQLTAKSDKAGGASRIGDFLKATQVELRKVTWPSKPELLKATRMVVVFSLVLGVAIGLLDWLLQVILVDGIARLAR
jgi:preprotein translocase SecE subunit